MGPEFPVGEERGVPVVDFEENSGDGPVFPQLRELGKRPKQFCQTPNKCSDWGGGRLPPEGNFFLFFSREKRPGWLGWGRGRYYKNFNFWPLSTF